MEEIVQLRRYVGRLSLAATVLLTMLAACVAGVGAAKGVLMGGLASMLGFAWAARSIKLDSSYPRRVRLQASFGVVARMGLYGAVLYKAYTLDPIHLRGFVGAAVGLMVTRLAVTVAGLTGWDQKKAE